MEVCGLETRFVSPSLLLSLQIIEKGEDYPAAEKNRLEKLVQSKITDEKKKVMRHKLNILPSFK